MYGCSFLLPFCNNPFAERLQDERYSFSLDCTTSSSQTFLHCTERSPTSTAVCTYRYIADCSFECALERQKRVKLQKCIQSEMALQTADAKVKGLNMNIMRIKIVAQDFFSSGPQRTINFFSNSFLRLAVFIFSSRKLINGTFSSQALRFGKEISVPLGASKVFTCKF